MAELLPGANIAIASVPNLRDLGGWSTPDGSVRRGEVYRSAGLDKLQDADLPAFDRLGLRSIYDMRTAAEREAAADRVPPGVEHVVVDVLADSTTNAAARVLGVLNDPVGADELLGDGRAVQLFEDGYREIVHLPSALASYRRLYTELAVAEHRPALFHCTTGKDRTGWAAACLLMLLGVSDADVLREFMLTNDELLPAMQPVFDNFEALGGDPELLRPVIGVREEYLGAALDEMHRRFGSIEDYFTSGLNIDAATQDSVRSAFAQPA